MEHSLEKYLERQSTEKLEGVLKGYLTMAEAEKYEDIIQMIRKVLEEREVKSKDASPPDCCILWVRFPSAPPQKKDRHRRSFL